MALRGHRFAVSPLACANVTHTTWLEAAPQNDQRGETMKCPVCDSTDIKKISVAIARCGTCQHEWIVQPPIFAHPPLDIPAITKATFEERSPNLRWDELRLSEQEGMQETVRAVLRHSRVIL